MKKVADTLKSLSSSEIYARILDPADPLDDVLALLKAHWSYDLYQRRPGPALLEDGVLKPTDLDLACFLSALMDRNAVINLPSYRSRRPATVRANEWIVSKENRHGNVVGLAANKEAFSFSVCIFDANVIRTESRELGAGSSETALGPPLSDTVGAYRNFMLVDLEGTWYDGWKSIEFMPSRKENDFLEDKSLWTGNTVYFDNFVHPNRWVSFYGQWYLLTKILIARLTAEAKFRRAEAKRLADRWKSSSSEEPLVFDFVVNPEQGPSKKIEITAFEAEVDLDEGKKIPEEFPPSPDTMEGFIAASDRARLLSYTEVPILRFATRATELAFSMREGPPFPSWVKGTSWERDYKASSRQRITWNRLVLHQGIPFARGLGLRYRTYTKTERVAP